MEVPPMIFWTYAVRSIIIRLLFLPTLAWNLLLGRCLQIRRWWDLLEGEPILLGALPFSRDVPHLRSVGVTGVINMCIEYHGPIKAYAQFDVEQLWLPTVDFTPPSLGNIHRGVNFIDKHVDAGGKVYVHCKAGRGRSATVVLCWLIHRRGFTPAQAAAYLTKQRPHINKGLAERAVVQEFHRSFLAQHDPTVTPQ